MSLTPEPAGVAQGPFSLQEGSTPRHAATRTGSSWAAARGAQRLVTLVLSANVTEYEQAQVEVETSPWPPGQARPGGRDEGGCVTPVPADGSRTADGGHCVVTSYEQRRARAGPGPTIRRGRTLPRPP